MKRTMVFQVELLDDADELDAATLADVLDSHFGHMVVGKVRVRRATAVPDLLETCKEMAAFYGEFVARGGRGESFAAWCDRANKMTLRALDVIAKAEDYQRREGE